MREGGREGERYEGGRKRNSERKGGRVGGRVGGETMLCLWLHVYTCTSIHREKMVVVSQKMSNTLLSQHC